MIYENSNGNGNRIKEIAQSALFQVIARAAMILAVPAMTGIAVLLWDTNREIATHSEKFIQLEDHINRIETNQTAEWRQRDMQITATRSARDAQLMEMQIKEARTDEIVSALKLQTDRIVLDLQVLDRRLSNFICRKAPDECTPK